MPMEKLKNWNILGDVRGRAFLGKFSFSVFPLTCPKIIQFFSFSVFFLFSFFYFFLFLVVVKYLIFASFFNSRSSFEKFSFHLFCWIIHQMMCSLVDMAPPIYLPKVDFWGGYHMYPYIDIFPITISGFGIFWFLRTIFSKSRKVELSIKWRSWKNATRIFCSSFSTRAQRSDISGDISVLAAVKQRRRKE